ncbi:MAG: hypothetical protein ACYDHW_15515 [Syntrophorhabdaceae bacterium]
MAKMIDEEKIMAYHTKESNEIVCPVCASDEERENSDPVHYITGVVVDPNPKYCVRCKKKIE